jgi:trigger factor
MNTSISLLNKLLASTSIEVPELMVENETEALVREFELQLADQGKPFDQSEANLARVRAGFREKAIAKVKGSIILQEVALREGIGVSPEEIDEQAQLLARKYNKTTEEVKKSSMQKIERSIQERKTLNFLLDHAVIREREKGMER